MKRNSRCEIPTELVVVYVDPNGDVADVDSIDKESGHHAHVRHLRCGDTYTNQVGHRFPVIRITRRIEVCHCSACMGDRFHAVREVYIQSDELATQPVLMCIDGGTDDVSPEGLLAIVRSFVAQVFARSAA